MNPVKRSFYALALIIALFSATSCLTTSPSRHYYRIRTDGQQVKRVGFDRILLIAPVDVDSFYDNYRIVYRESDYEINQYLYHLWYKKPSQMIRENLMTFFASSHLFVKTTDLMTEGDPDFILHCKMLNIEEILEGNVSWARIAMEWVLSDFRSGQELLRHQFDNREQTRGKRIVDLVRSLSSLLNKELVSFSDKIADRLEHETDK